MQLEHWSGTNQFDFFNIILIIFRLHMYDCIKANPNPDIRTTNKNRTKQIHGNLHS